MLKYGILDCDGVVIRWVWQRPPIGYDFVVVKDKRPRKPPVDLSQFEESPF
jgi:hypothetical protein